MDFHVGSKLFKDVVLFDFARVASTGSTEDKEQDFDKRAQLESLEQSLAERLKDCVFRTRQSAKSYVELDVSKPPPIMTDLKSTLERKQLQTIDRTAWLMYDNPNKEVVHREKSMIYMVVCCHKLYNHMASLLDALQIACEKTEQLYKCYLTLAVKVHHEIHTALDMLIHNEQKKYDQAQKNAMYVRNKEMIQLHGRNREHLQVICKFLSEWVAYQDCILSTLDFYQENMAEIDRKYGRGKRMGLSTGRLNMASLLLPDNIKLSSEHLKQCEEILEQPEQIAVCFMQLRTVHDRTQDLLDHLTRSQYTDMEKMEETFQMKQVFDHVKSWRLALGPVLLLLARTRHYIRSGMKRAKKGLEQYQQETASLKRSVESWKKKQQQQLMQFTPTGYNGRIRISEKDVSVGLKIQDELDKLLPDYNEALERISELQKTQATHEQLMKKAFHKSPVVKELFKFEEREQQLAKNLRQIQTYQESTTLALAHAHDEQLAKWKRKAETDFLSEFLINDGQRMEEETKLWNTFEKQWKKVYSEMFKLEQHVSRHYDQSLLAPVMSTIDIDDLASSVKGATELFRQHVDAARHDLMLQHSKQLLQFTDEILRHGNVKQMDEWIRNG